MFAAPSRHPEGHRPDDRREHLRPRSVAAVAVTLLAGTAAVAPTTAGAATVSASYGVLGTRQVNMTPTTAGLTGKRLRVVLETQSGKKKTVRASRPLSRGGGRLRWTYPKGTKQLKLRVRVVRVVPKTRKQRRRERTLATSPWRVLQTRNLKPGAPISPVKRENVLSAPPAGQPGSLVLNGAPKVRTGDAVVLPVTPATPEGLLVKATAVAVAGGQTVVATEPTTIPDVIPVGSLDVNLGADAPATARSSSPLQRLKKAMTCSNGREASASAEASVSAGLSLSTSWRRSSTFSVPKLTARFQGDVRATVNAGASVSGEASCTLDREPLFASPLRLATVTTSIGPVPVVLTVDGQIYLSAQAAASGKLETSMTATAGASAGVEYDGKGFKPFGRLDKSLTLQPPTITASGSLSASLAPAVSVKLYGLAGPEVDFSAGLKAAATLSPPPGEPWWKITAPLSAGVRFQLKAFTLDLSSDRYEIWKEEPELARAQTPPGGSSISAPTTSPDPLPTGIRTRLTWDSNSDVDLHTWDAGGDHAYFRDLNAIDSGFLDQDVIPGYGPETFQETDPGHTFTFGVCQYSGTQANVTVDTRDPDGRTRRYTVTLRGKKAAALLTVSPEGEPAFISEDRWCSEDDTDPTAIGQTTTGSFAAGSRAVERGPKALPGAR